MILTNDNLIENNISSYAVFNSACVVNRFRIVQKIELFKSL